MICYLLTRNKSKNTKIICYTISLLLIILIAISRIYLKVHYFSDVIGGLIYGIVVFLLLKNLINKYFKEKNI